MDAAAELRRNPVSKHQVQPEYGDEQADAGRTAEPVSRDQIFRRERGQPAGKYSISCSAGHLQDWQPYRVDPYSCYMCNHIHKVLYCHCKLIICMHVCVCVFASHSFWTSSSLDVPAGVTQKEGHTGFLIHLSAVRAFIFIARRIQPFLSLVDREVEFCVLII